MKLHNFQESGLKELHGGFWEVNNRFYVVY